MAYQSTISSLGRRRRRRQAPSGVRSLAPVDPPGTGAPPRHHGGGGRTSSTPSPGISDFGRSGGGSSSSTGGAPSVTIPSTSSGGGRSVSTVPPSNAVSPSSRTGRSTTSLLTASRGRGATLERVTGSTTLLQSLDREFKPGETITAREAAILAEAFGLPGRTYAQIGKGESRLEPAAESDDGGLGLWQMTPRVQSPETVSKWEKIASQHKGGYFNPVANAKMASVLAGGGTGVSNYYGTGFVTNEDAHIKGGQSRAQKLLGGDPGKTTGPKPLKTNELFYDPGINLKDGAPTSPIGGHSDHVHFASTSPRSILRAAKVAENKGLNVSENPAFGGVEPVHTGGSYHYQEKRIPNKLLNSKLYRKSGASGNVIGEAIDLNMGTPEQMAAVDQRLAKLSGGAVSGGYGGGTVSGTTFTSGGGTVAPGISGTAPIGSASRGMTSRSRGSSVGAASPIQLPFAARAPMPQSLLGTDEEAADASSGDLAPADILAMLAGGTVPKPRKRLRAR